MRSSSKHRPTQRARPHAPSAPGRDFRDDDESAGAAAVDATAVFEDAEFSDDGGEVESWFAEHYGRLPAYSDLM